LLYWKLKKPVIFVVDHDGKDRTAESVVVAFDLLLHTDKGLKGFIPILFRCAFRPQCPVRRRKMNVCKWRDRWWRDLFCGLYPPVILHTKYVGIDP
jgi:hypothetical protein